MKVNEIASVLTVAAALFATPVLEAAWAPAWAQETEEEILEFNKQSYFEGEAPIAERLDYENTIWMTTRPKEEIEKNAPIEDQISAEAKMRFMQSSMAYNPLGVRDMINLMVAKKKALPGLTFDEVIESMQSKAFDLNMRPTGHNTPYIILRESMDPKSPRLEFLSFCDLITMRMIIDFSVEFSVFLPCRISVLEDSNGDIWLMTLDWDARWMDTSPNPNRIPDDLRERAIKVRKNVELIMDAGATGDF